MPGLFILVEKDHEFCERGFYFISFPFIECVCASVYQDLSVGRDALSLYYTWVLQYLQQRQKLLNETNKKQLVTEFDVKLTILQRWLDAAELPIFSRFRVYQFNVMRMSAAVVAACIAHSQKGACMQPEYWISLRSLQISGIRIRMERWRRGSRRRCQCLLQYSQSATPTLSIKLKLPVRNVRTLYYHDTHSTFNVEKHIHAFF